MTQLTEIATALASPFAIEEIGLLPKGKFERDGKTLCMAMPYADPRAYQVVIWVRPEQVLRCNVSNQRQS